MKRQDRCCFNVLLTRKGKVIMGDRDLENRLLIKFPYYKMSKHNHKQFGTFLFT